MGQDVDREEFDPSDYDRFSEVLSRSISALDGLLERPGFGEGPTTVGAELELHLVDTNGRPAPVNHAVVAEAADDRVTLEINRYNVEINTLPSPIAGRPFERMAAELENALAVTRAAARAHDADAIMIGILPTLTESDLRSSALTDRCRFRALSAGIRRTRGEPATVRIEGREVLEVTTDDVTFEGANTSFQVHLRVAPAAFARTYNAAQIATGFALAVSGNSPFFLGRRLWEETRVALFRQAVENRHAAREDDWRPSRVSFGHGWVRRSACELFAQSVGLHSPLLPQCSGDDDPLETARRGGVPKLRELRLHHGTVWTWNRAVYDPAAEGHLRIEMRALPAGPTVRDMVANAALTLGLTLALSELSDDLVSRVTFGQARRTFYDAARFGLDAGILWPAGRAPSPRKTSPIALAAQLLPMACSGLVRAGVDAEEAAGWLAVIAERIARRTTGARWQRRLYEALASSASTDRAVSQMLARYRELSDGGTPVHTWPEA